MGWKSGAAVGAAGGMVFGPIGAAIGGAIGGAIGAMCEDDQGEELDCNADEVSVYLTKKGLMFSAADVLVYWSQVEDLAFDKNDGMDAFTLVGGMEINCPSDLVRYGEDGEDEVNKQIRERQVPSIEDLFDGMADDEPTDNVLAAANKSMVSIATCKELLPLLQQDENLVVDFIDCPYKLFQLGDGLRKRFDLTLEDPYDFDSDGVAIMDWAAQNLDQCLALSQGFADSIANDEHYLKHPSALKTQAGILAEFELIIQYLLQDGQSFDKAGYALYQSSVSIEDSPDASLCHDQAVKWLAFEFSKEVYERERRIIVCTNESRSLGQSRVEIPGVAILRAETLEAANDEIRDYDAEEEAERYLEELGDEAEDVKHAVAVRKGREAYEARLKRVYQFEMGHPRNGITYVQHPIEKNKYIDINSFNTTLLERKYDELIRVLTALGATSITCSIVNDRANAKKRSGKRSVGGDIYCAYGDANVSFDSSSLSERTFALNKKLSCKISRKPKQKPYFPTDTVFFKFEDRWVQMAKDVLSGQRMREEVDLSYRKEYSLSCDEARQVGVKLGTLIPGFQLGGSVKYLDEYKAELKELESIVWHYEVEFGCVENSGVGSALKKKKGDSPHATVTGKAEATILGRAKRYAKTEGVTRDGMLTAAQHADLEKLASKYGVDDLRLEELIDEAFV